MDAGLLVLRLWIGLTLLCLHGWGKLSGFSALADKFPDPLGVGSPVSMGLATFAETVCALFLALGLFTRLAALILVIHFSVAFSLVHHFVLKGQMSGEPAFIYLAGCVTVLIAGGGRLAVDCLASKQSQAQAANVAP
jgi:putative oxidoreductase